MKPAGYWLGWAALGLVAGLVLLALGKPSGPDPAVVAKAPTPPSARLRVEQADPAAAEGRYVVDISVHSRRELEALLDRVERLSAGREPPPRGPDIALVLHGPEIAFFARSNYAEYRELVDRVAALDARGIIDTKMCQTMMRLSNIRESDVPGFIEFVPYGPDEIERLVIREGRVRM